MNIDRTLAHTTRGDPIMLTPLIFIIATATLSALAIRFGCDSRPGAWSGEQEYAVHGLASGEACEGDTTGIGHRGWLPAAQRGLRHVLLVLRAGAN